MTLNFWRSCPPPTPGLCSSGERGSCEHLADELCPQPSMPFTDVCDRMTEQSAGGRHPRLPHSHVHIWSCMYVYTHIYTYYTEKGRGPQQDGSGVKDPHGTSRAQRHLWNPGEGRRELTKLSSDLTHAPHHRLRPLPSTPFTQLEFSLYSLREN